MERRVDGVAINGEFLASVRNPEEFSLVREISQYMPVVLQGCVLEELPCITVTTDLSNCIELSVSHLTELNHSRIALLGGNNDLSIPLSRDVGYHQALERTGLAYRAEYRIFGECSTQGGYDAVRTLLSGLPAKEWPTAIIAANDLVAVGIMKHLMERNLKIPKDISVIGCDNQFFSPFTSPALTTLDTKPQEIGNLSVSLLLSSQDTIQKTHHTICADLVVRETSGPCPNNS